MTRTRTHTHGRDAHGRERERERERALLGTTVYNRHTHAHTWELERLCPVTVPWSVDGVVAAEQERILRVSRRMHSRSGFALRPQPMTVASCRYTKVGPPERDKTDRLRETE